MMRVKAFINQRELFLSTISITQLKNLHSNHFPAQVYRVIIKRALKIIQFQPL